MLKILRSRKKAAAEPTPEPSSEETPTATPTPAPTAVPGIRVLIADDSRTNRFLLDNAAKRCRLETVHAEDGAQAMKAFTEHDDLKLILLDWMMPNWSGLDVCRWIRQQERGDRVYVLLITARNQREDIRSGLAHGADDFLTKPVDPTELELRIKAGLRVLRMQQRMEANIQRLEGALSEVQTLRKLIPMCMYCKSVRDDQGYWAEVETYLRKHADTSVSHGVCPTCYEEQVGKLEAK